MSNPGLVSGECRTRNPARECRAANRIGSHVPPMGKISMMFITDKQYGMVRNCHGRIHAESERKPDQLALF